MLGNGKRKTLFAAGHLMHALIMPQYLYLALFPGLPTIQSLIACSVQKTEGGGLVHFIMWMASVSTLGRQRRGRRVPDQRTSLRLFLVVSVLSTWVWNVCEAKNVRLLVQNEECVPRCAKYWSKTGWWEGLGTRLSFNTSTSIKQTPAINKLKLVE